MSTRPIGRGEREAPPDDGVPKDYRDVMFAETVAPS